MYLKIFAKEMYLGRFISLIIDYIHHRSFLVGFIFSLSVIILHPDGRKSASR